MDIKYRPIGIIHSSFSTIEDMPIQPAGAYDSKGFIEVFPDYALALQDLAGFSHIYLLYHFHQCEDWQALVIPFLDNVKRGLFATRAPKRPNPIGLSVVRLISLKENLLEIENVDILDGTPLLDIKPYVPDFDNFEVQSIGWLQDASEKVKNKRSDERFK